MMSVTPSMFSWRAFSDAAAGLSQGTATTPFCPLPLTTKYMLPPCVCLVFEVVDDRLHSWGSRTPISLRGDATGRDASSRWFDVADHERWLSACLNPGPTSRP